MKPSYEWIVSMTLQATLGAATQQCAGYVISQHNPNAVHINHFAFLVSISVGSERIWTNLLRTFEFHIFSTPLAG